MTPNIVRRLLLDSPDRAKEIHTSDGAAVVVVSREQWMATPDTLVVLDKNQVLHHITYWNITSIRHLVPNGKKKGRKKRTGRR